MVLLLPDSDTAHAPLVVALVLAATAMAAFMLFLAPVIGSSAYLVSDSLAVPSVALGVYLTGGTTSPLLPLIFIAVTFAAYFSTRRGALIRLLGATVVGATPFAYAAGDQRLLFVSRFIALISTAAVLVGIIVYNRRELAQAQRTARELASRDPLTGLANRRAFERHVLAGLKAARVEGDSRLSISIIDLDNFKRVNDLYGHAAGDTLLNEIASGLRAVAGQEDLVARIGGDEFALVSRGADSTSSRAAGVRCVKAVEDAVVRAGYAECDVSATVGYAIFPDHGETLTELVQAADSALMQAKDDGKHTVAGAPGPAPRFTRSEAPASAASAR
jgi:diguanylate cyclase (GGDEF)-like protein